MIEASMFAAESQFGSLSIERTERRMDSKQQTREDVHRWADELERERDEPTDWTGDQRSDARS